MNVAEQEEHAAHQILILMAHTGGGHLRAAEAVAEALRRRHGQSVAIEIVDAVGEYGPFPFNRLDRIYPWWINRAAITWRWGYRITDGRRRANAMLRFFWPMVWPRARRLLCRYPADVIVSTHPLTNHFAVWTLRRLARVVPTLTLVTDPISVHSFWLSPHADRCLVGSTEAQHKALAYGLNVDQVHVTGYPVSPCFLDGLMDKARARRALGWFPDQPAVLLLGGGEGMGRLYQTARTIDLTCSGVQLAVVAGRNDPLKERLENSEWRLPTYVYGFVNHTQEMPQLMSAADVLLTKAGPGSIHEAFLAGLPLVLSGAVPGQEEGNVRLVVEGGAGVWAPDPHQAAAVVARWMGAESGKLTHLAACSRALARPGAASAAADVIWELALTNL
jgi:1,2-diacylglycerol 3-beta-galactosyltransferase